MSIAASLFNSLDLAAVRSLATQGQEEHLHLDFKTITRPDLSDRGDKKNLAVALSGFANSDGGVVVWGINARPTAQGVDCAVGEAPIEGLQQFLTKLNEFTGQFVSPLVDGVRHVTLPLNGDIGFAVTLVPSSDSGPHMAKAGEDRYYKRAGSSFYRLEHFDVADMFGRRARPLIRPRIVISPQGTTTGGGVLEHYGRVTIALENAGRGLARFPYLTLEVKPPFSIDPFGIDGGRTEGLPRVRTLGSAAVTYGGGADAVIHAGTSRDIAAVRVGIHVDHKARISPPAPLVLVIGVAAEGVPFETHTFVSSPEDLMAAILPDSLYTRPKA